MLTVEQRRHVVLALRDRDDLAPAAAVAVRAASAILDDQTRRMALLLGLPTMEGQDEILNPLIKPVGDACNLRCKYCCNQPGQSVQVMSDELLESMIRQVLELYPAGVNIEFHGGEPLLAGRDFFQRAVELEAQYRRPGQTVGNGVQTNATLIDAEWADWFAEHCFQVGVSLDGPPEVHDRNRVDAAGRGTFDRVARGMGLLRERGLKVSAISVVTNPPSTPPAKLYDFVHSMGISSWRVNPCRTPETNACYGEYVEGVFDAWAGSGGQMKVGVIQDTLLAALGYSPTTCSLAGSCAHFVGLDPDGTLSPCCEMTIPAEFRFGNLNEQSLDDLLHGPRAQAFWREWELGTAACEPCEWFAYCHGGCTRIRLEAAGTPAGKDYLCDAYRDAARRLTGRLDQLLATAAAGMRDKK